MNSKKPSIRQLEYFSAVARASNFRKAAERLGVSQPTLTMQIADLEELLGVQLFDRSRAGTLLTPAGRSLLPLAREILEQFERLADISQASQEAELNGCFRLGVLPTLGPALLPGVIPELHRRYPALQLHLHEGLPESLEAGLHSGDFDLILTMLPMQNRRYRIRPLFTERLKIVLHRDHPLARKQQLRGRDLHQQGLLGISKQLHLHQQVQSLADRYGAQVLQELQANSLAMLQLMVQMNMGIAVLPELFIEANPDHGDCLRVFDLDDEPLSRTCVAVWRNNASSRHQSQKLSFEIKAIAVENFGTALDEVMADESLPDTW